VNAREPDDRITTAEEADRIRSSARERLRLRRAQDARRAVGWMIVVSAVVALLTTLGILVYLIA
jgi:cytochrome c-type biogenesis protein CcmH/NrfG